MSAKSSSSRIETVTFTPTPHALHEDMYAMVVGTAFIITGLAMLKAGGLVTGGIAGIALLVSYIFPLPVGAVFTLVNIPFFIFAWFTMGARFALMSCVVSIAVTCVLAVMPSMFQIAFVNQAFAAIVGGTLCGMGVLALARHGAGVGGTGVITLWLQRKRGINAGISQFCIDCGILAVSLVVIPSDRVAWSALSALALSGMVMAWHRPGRYTGQRPH